MGSVSGIVTLGFFGGPLVTLGYGYGGSPPVIIPGPFFASEWLNWQPGGTKGLSFQPGQRDAIEGDSFQPGATKGTNL